MCPEPDFLIMHTSLKITRRGAPIHKAGVLPLAQLAPKIGSMRIAQRDCCSAVYTVKNLFDIPVPSRDVSSLGGIIYILHHYSIPAQGKFGK
jgi:hypothetical protein